MGAIEDEFNRGRKPAPSTGVPPTQRVMQKLSAAQAQPPAAAPPAPAPATPAPGERLRAAASNGLTLGDRMQTLAGPPAPPEAHPLRNQAPAAGGLSDRLRGVQGPPAPSPTRIALETPPAGQTLGQRLQGMAGPPAPSATRIALETPPAGPTLAQRMQGAAGPAAPPPEAAPPGQKLNARPIGDLLAEGDARYGAAERLRNPAPVGPTLADAIKSRTPAAPYNTPAAGGGGAGAVPPGAPPAAAAAGGGKGFIGRAAGSIAEHARAAMPPGMGKVAKGVGIGGVAAGGAVAAVAKKSLPWITPVVEGIDVARVAADPQATKGDVAVQALEGTGRFASTVAGAGIGGAAGATLGPVGAAVGGIAGGIAGYAGGDAAIKKLRDVFGLDSQSPIDKTDARRQAERQAAAKIPAISEPAERKPPKAAAPVQAPGAPGVRTAADTPANTPTAPAAAAPSQMQQQLAALQARQDASPIAQVVNGSGGTQVVYKDGSVTRLGAGMEVPPELQEFNQTSAAMRAITSGQPVQGAAPAAPSAPAQRMPTRPGRLGNVMAFAEQYGPAAERAAASLGVDPNLLLAKWGHETAWGKSVIPGTNNLGNIKAVGSQPGVAATDNMTGSRDNYMSFANPEAFADHYAGLINKRYQGAVGAGADVSKFAAGLSGYAEDPKYATKLGAAYQTLLKARGAAPGPSIEAAAQQTAMGAPVAPAALGSVTASPTGIEQPVHVIRGLDQTMALPGPTNNSMYEVAMPVFDRARRGSNGFGPGGVIDQWQGQHAAGIMNRFNPTAAAQEQERIRGQYQNMGQAIAGEYGLEQQRISNEGRVQAAPDSKMTILPGGETIDPVTKLPVKQPSSVVYMDNGKPQFASPPSAAPARTPSAASIELLRKSASDQALVAQFEATYGPGSAAKYLAQ